MPRPPRRYCDQAATSWPKPPDVINAWQQAAVEIGAAAGRGGYREAVEASAILEAARGAWGRLLGGVDPRRIAMPATATLGLNIALQGLLRPGDHVIATAADHNATLRPLHHLATRGVIELTILPCDGLGSVDPDEIAGAWQPATRMVAYAHASNVTGTVQDATAIARLTRERGGVVLLDASQTAGVLPLDADPVADVLVAPGHKWLLGAHGNACLWCRDGIEPEPLVLGGTGSASDSLEMPEAFTARHEAGTPDLPAAAALVAAERWWRSPAGTSAAAVGRQCAEACREGLTVLPGVRVIAAENGPPIVSFAVDHYAPAEVAAAVEAMTGAQVRSGFHCAALVHRSLGTPEGTVRASFGPFNGLEDSDAIIMAVGQLVSSTVQERRES